MFEFQIHKFFDQVFTTTCDQTFDKLDFKCYYRWNAYVTIMLQTYIGVA